MSALLSLLALLAVGLLAPSSAEAARLIRHGVIACDTTASGVQIVAANVNRSAPLYIFNTDAATAVFTGSGNPDALTTANGVELRPQTGRYISDGASGQPYTGVYRCITAAGSINLRYEEVLD